MTKEHRKYYAESDGNGGMIISKRVMAIIAFIIMLGTSLVTVVAMETTFKNDLGYLKTQTETIGIRQVQNFAEHKDLTTSDAQQKEQIAVLKSEIQTMKGDISEIKSDVKKLLTR